MRQIGSCMLGLAGLYFLTLSASATTPLDELEKELNEVKQQHQDASSQASASFFSAIDAAGASPDAAMTLYQQAGGLLPVPTIVTTQYVNETPDEKSARLAKDQENAARIGYVVQAHCQLMHYAALFATNPDTKGLKDDWVAWLKKIGPTYPNLKSTEGLRGLIPPDATDPNADNTTNSGSTGHKKKQRQDGNNDPNAPTRPLGDWKTISIGDSIIGKYLGFKPWEGKDQAQWAVKDIPKFYRTDVLDPLRATPTADTLAAWDTYIAMKQSDARDQDKWTRDEYPALQFERSCDDFAATPSTEKLQGLVELIKANPTHSKADDWLSKVKTLMDNYRAQKYGAAVAPATTSAAPASDPNVTVTTQGDMTIITTNKTNAAPASPTPTQ